MSEVEKVIEGEEDDFKFDVEAENVDAEEITDVPEPELEIEDDTPEEDRDKSPMPKEIIDELEADELTEYSDKVKQRMKQMKKVWHDERRAKEDVLRQQNESIALNRRLIEENKRIKQEYHSGEQTLIDTYKKATELELNDAKRRYKEAYDSGDSDAVVEAQQALNAASLQLDRISNYTPTLQEANNELYINQQQAVPKPDNKTISWQERNSWYGKEPEMTALALGFHQKLERDRGKQYVGTDEYWQEVDATMKKRFPEYFGSTETIEATDNGGGKPVNRTDKKPASVVASAARSTSPKRVVLKQSQVRLAKKLGITPEQYAREFAKLESN